MKDMTVFMLKGERTALAHERINALARQDINVKSKTIEAIVNDFKYAPYDTIMFNVEKAGYDRNDINIINEVMSLI